MADSRCDICKTVLPADQLVTIGGKSVCAQCKPDVVMNMKSGVAAVGQISPQRAEEIRARISKLNILSFVLALPGLALQFAGPAMLASGGPVTPAVASSILLIRLVGVPLVIGGLVCYAMMKGRSGALGLLGFLSCLGLLILHFLPKNCHNCSARGGYSAKKCTSCGAPM
ncbi:MAG: hypothetical protein HY293_16620 [Planctomycetes bacterium]|nr:hypothetical protein [Planctomycetota bacterium]